MKTIKTMNYIILILLFLLNNTCKKNEDCHKIIKVFNTSNKAIYVQGSDGYPDTMYFKYNPNPALSPEINKVESGETNTTSLQIKDCWEINIKNVMQSDKLMIYIFDSEILENIPWDTVIANNMVLNRYDLSLEDLKNSNWSITYP